MKFPDDVRELLQRKFKNNHQHWLKEAAFVKCDFTFAWPLEINLDIPAEKEALRRQDNTRSWVSAWSSWRGNGSLFWIERRWRSLGTQKVPEKLALECPGDVAWWIGEAAKWSLAVDRYTSLVRRWPALADVLPRHYKILTCYDDLNFMRLSCTLAWLYENPSSGYYIRQIPVAGIDSKWLESRKNLVCELVAAIRGDTSGERDFYQLCGLNPLPHLIRMRVLDPDLRSGIGGLCDISVPPEEAARLCLAPANVFIVENIQTGLAFNDLKNSVVIMGLGYGVDVLGKIPWLRYAQCIYWGDIDTHGLAILNRARSYLPNLKAVFMDEAVLLSHRELWVQEKDQHPSADLSLLSCAELELFRSLKSDFWGQKIRLEQERIRFDAAWNVLRQFVL